MSLDIVECFLSLSRSLDFTYHGLMNHHYRTALIAVEIGKAIGLPDNRIIDLFQAAIIHDIGVISWQEKIELTQFEIKSPWQHCQKGDEILKDNPSLGHLSDIILCHHDRWSGKNPSGLIKNAIPLDSRIIHLADRIDILISNYLNILEQRDMIVNQVYQASGVIFDPDLTAVFQSLAARDSFWFNIALPWSQECLNEMLPPCRTRVDLKYLLDIAKLFAQVVDAKSHFTYRHSRGVAMTARLMGEELHMPDEDCSLLEVAGLLHDLGKLAIPSELLEKPARLTTSEYNLIKQHAYYTYWLLKPLTRKVALAEWAAYHHERPNGQGYPFAKSGAELDDKSRLIAAADIFTALREVRPYRTNMSWNQITRIMNQLADNKDLDKDSTALILDNQKKLDQRWSQI